MPRRRVNPSAWIGIAVLVLVAALAVRAIGGGDAYQGAALRLAASNATLGREVAALRTGVKDLERQALQRNLRRWRREGAAQADGVQRLEPPAGLRLANGYLSTALGLRADALRRLEPAVGNALSDRELQVAVSQLVAVMRDLMLADRAWELLRSAWPNDEERKPPVSRWVGDQEDATVGGVTDFVRELRKQDSLAAVYNLRVVSATLDPKPAGKDGERDVIPFTRSLSVAFVVENTGNQPVPATTVAAILTSEADPEPQSVEGRIGSLRPGDKRAVTLRGLEPTAGGPVNLLKVTVGPVGGERNTLDNILEVEFVMRKP